MRQVMLETIAAAAADGITLPADLPDQQIAATRGITEQEALATGRADTPG